MKPLALLLALALSAAAEDIPVRIGSHALKLQVGDTERTYRLHVPDSFSRLKPASLVVALHGLGGTGAQMERITQFSKLSDERGFVVVYPDGLNRMWRCTDRETGKPDLDFIKALLDALVESKIADPLRIYVTGISNGAYMTNWLAVAMGDRIAAIAPVAGTILKPMVGRMKPALAVPVMYFHGTEDPIVRFDGKAGRLDREVSLSAEELVDWWVKANESKKPNTAVMHSAALLRDSRRDGTTVERQETSGDAPVVFYKITGGGHTWPGMARGLEHLLGRVCRDIDATKLIWDFFEHHPPPEEPK